MPNSLLNSTCTPTASAAGENSGPRVAVPWKTILDAAASPSFPPLDRATIASIACDVVARTGNPLSRQSTTDLAKRAQDELDKPISRTTVWRILDEDAIKPWQYEHWIFPRAADFFSKAAVVLDLYEGYWQEERLEPFDRIISSDEKRASRPGFAVIRLCRRAQDDLGESKRNTRVAAPCNTWRPGMSRKGWSWAAARRRRALSRSGDWSNR